MWREGRARKIFSVPVAKLSRVPFFWSHFLSSWSQSCAKTPKFRRKKKKSYLWGHLLHTSGHEHHQWNDSKFLFFGNENRWKAKKKKKKKKEKKKKLTRKKLGPAHSHETLRGRGRSCWIQADKKYANRAKRKRKRRKRKEKCAYMCEQPWHHHGRLKQFWLQQCTMLESAVLTWTWACCASNCTLLAERLPCFFRSRYVRPATLLSISQARKWSPSLWSLKNRSSPWFLRAQAKNQHFLGCLSTSRLLEESSLRRVTVADGCLRMNCIAARNQTFSSYLSLKLSVLPLHADLPWKVLVVSNHALLKSFLQRKKQSLPDVRLHVGWIVDRSMDPEVLTANLNGQVPHDEACRSLRTSTVFGRLSTAGTSNWRDSRHCLLSELETKAVSNFCFPNLVAKTVHLVAMMRLIFGF